MPTIHTRPDTTWQNYDFLNKTLPAGKHVDGLPIIGWNYDISTYGLDIASVKVDLSEMEISLEDFNEWGIEVVKKIEAKTGKEVHVYLT